MTREYAYTGLESGSLTCRVLSLLPGAFDDDIYIELHPTRLIHGHAAPFEALSYTWGSEDNRQKVFVASSGSNTNSVANSSDFILVTRNLMEVLRYLRWREASRQLWIDALCINQGDKIERGAQVQLMPLIYRSATHVLVWLGPEADDSHWAIGTFRWWASKVSYDLIKDRLTLKVSSEADAWMVNTSIALRHDGRDFMSCRALIERSWFERLWIQQEIHLGSSKATVLCGYDSIPWLELYTGMHFFARRAVQTGTHDTPGFLARRRLVSLIGSGQQVPIGDLLLNARRSKCKEPRDKVYAILGMLRDQDAWLAEAIKPDYDAKLEDLYKLVLELDIKRRRSLSMLQFCQPELAPSWRPTWVPNWAAPETAEPLIGLECQYADLFAYTASVDILGEVLLVKGVIAATVSDVEGVRLRVKDHPKAVLSEIKRLSHRMSVCLSAATGVELLKAMLYTVSIGKLWDGDEPLSMYDPVVLLLALITDEYNINDHDDIYHKADSPAVDPLINVCSQALPYRSMARTDKGHLVLGPTSMRPGDVLAVVLGLSKVMVLRPQHHGHYELVGLCYAYGLNWGEALAGPLPSTWHYLRKVRPSGSWVPAFKNNETGEVSEWDPRIKWDQLIIPESEGWRNIFFWKEGDKIWKYPDEEYLLRNGVQLHTLRLV